MDLWIRSQNKKEIARVENVRIATVEENLYRNEKSDYSNCKYCIVSYEAMNVLGYYETEERALKVINEIYERITDTFIFNTSRLYYQMPENKEEEEYE